MNNLTTYSISKLIGLAITFICVPLIIIPLPSFLLTNLILINIAVLSLSIFLTTFSSQKNLLANSPPFFVIATTLRLGTYVAIIKKIILEANSNELSFALGNLITRKDYLIGTEIYLFFSLLFFTLSFICLNSIVQKTGRTRTSNVDQPLRKAAKYMTYVAIFDFFAPVITILGAAHIGLNFFSMDLSTALEFNIPPIYGNGLLFLFLSFLTSLSLRMCLPSSFISKFFLIGSGILLTLSVLSASLPLLAFFLICAVVCGSLSFATLNFKMQKISEKSE